MLDSAGCSPFNALDTVIAMSDDAASFLARPKASAGIRDTAPLVLVGNFEVERHWALGEPGLPTFRSPASDLVVNRMDEFALTLAGPHDVVIVKQPPDPGHLAYLASLGWRTPRVLTPSATDPGRDVVEDALADPALLGQLARLADQGAAIHPHGMSPQVQELADACGLALTAPPAAVCKAVNSKIYSRTLVERLGLRQPAGWCCDDIDRWREAVAWARGVLAAGNRVAVKDAFGVSGRGILVIDAEARLDQVDRMLRTRAARRGEDRLGVVVEQWVPTSADLNYQFVVFGDGTVGFDFVKLALTERGVHKGHLMPAPVTEAVHAEIVDVATRVGAALAEDGYHGVVGIDAMLDPDGGLYPVTEINARNNMSTYQEPLVALCGLPHETTLARYYPLAPDRTITFDRVRQRLGDLLFTAKGEGGLVVNNFATAVAGVPANGAGRLYGLLFGADLDAVRDIDDQVTERLSIWQPNGRKP